jgi:cytochrome b561
LRAGAASFPIGHPRCFLYVMAGGYGVNLFGVWELPNPIGARPWLASVAKWTHVASAYVLVATLAGHVGLVLWHTLVMKDGLVRRMLPGRSGRRV